MAAIEDGIDSKFWEFLVLGMIMFIPGSYYSVIILRIALGHEGYKYDMLDMVEEAY